MSERPIYICFEGLDGSGKTTLFKKIVKKLKEEGFTLCEVSPTQKCGEHDLWENIYDKFKFLKDIIFFRNFLYAHRSNIVAKNIDWNVDLLIGDRSIITSFMCRWSKYELKNKKIIARVNFLESKIPTPDYAIYLDVTPENLQKRLKSRGNTDIDETEKRSQEMRYAYDFLRNNPKAVSRIEKVKWLVIDGNPPEEEVFQNAWEEIISLLQNVKK